jgi:hypothetical protein
MSFNRYTMAVQNIALMTSKWGDVALQMTSFDTMMSSDDYEERQTFRVELVHLISLLHGTALLKMRCDDDIANLKEFGPGYESGSGFSSGTEKWGGPLWKLVGSNLPLGTSPLGLRSEAAYFAYHAANPLLVIGGVTDSESRALARVEDKSYLVMQWVVDIVVLQGKLKWLEVEGPIVSRIYQELSDGMLGYNQARKLTEIPFPYPYAKLMTSLLAIFALTVPFLISSWVEDTAAAGTLAFVAVWAYYAINEVTFGNLGST